MRKSLGPLVFVTLAIVLSGCLRVSVPQKTTELGPTTGPEIVVLVSKTGQAARSLMHDVAVNCWLDGIVAGEGNGPLHVTSKNSGVLSATTGFGQVGTPRGNSECAARSDFRICQRTYSRDFNPKFHPRDFKMTTNSSLQSCP